MTREINFSSALIFFVGISQPNVFIGFSYRASNPLSFQSFLAVASTMFLVFLLSSYYIENRKSGRKVKRVFLLLCLFSLLLLPVHAIEIFYNIENLAHLNTVSTVLSIIGVLHFFTVLAFTISEELQVLKEKNK